MGQSPSQEAHTGANGEPEPLVLHQPAGKRARRQGVGLANARATKDKKPKKVSAKNNDTSGSEDDESDWSDWDAKASKGRKQTPLADGGPGPFTYETTSSGEGENDSDEEEQLSRTEYTLPLREGSYEPDAARLSKCSPNQVQGGDSGEDGENEEVRSAALTNARGDRNTGISVDTSDSLGRTDRKAFAEPVASAKHVAEEPTPRRTQETARQTHGKQSLRLEGASQPHPPGPQHENQHSQDMAPVRTTASDPDTSSSSSIFDVQDSTLVNSDLLQHPTLKRKRQRPRGRVSGPEGQPSCKRRKRSIFSPPTSVSPLGHEALRASSSPLKAIRGRFKINRPLVQSKSVLGEVAQDQGSVNGWVRPLSFGRSLKHPLFNPSPLKHPRRSRTVNITGPDGEHSTPSTSLEPCRSARKSGRGMDDVASVVEESDYDEGSKIPKKSKQVVSSPKGKGKAKAGVECVSPSDVTTRNTTLIPSKESTRTRRPKLPTTSASNNIQQEEIERHSGGSSEPGTNTNLSEAETKDSAGESSAPKELVCKTCNRKFRNDKQLQTHRNNNKARAASFECWKCGDDFDDKALLLRHQTQKNHPRETFHARRTGPFSESEKLKLERFMMDYCDRHGIDEPVFRQMMTDSSRRGPDATWSWPGVTKYAFLNEYFSVLPDRAHKSMQRYKERYLQNLDHNKEWTKEDDKLLVDLVNEIGPKWTEIGLRFNRTQDSVTQRYKKRLKNEGTAQSGLWSSRESSALAKAVQEIKDDLGLADATDTDEHIPWFEISKRMGGIRTAHQCSTRWHRVQRRKQMSKRQNANTGRTRKSKEFVSSDDEEQTHLEDDRPHEGFVGLVVPSKLSKSLSRAKPDHSSESDGPALDTDQASEPSGVDSDAAAQKSTSPDLGSSGYTEPSSKPSPIHSPSGPPADPAGRYDEPCEPVVANTAKWTRMVDAKEQTLPPLAPTDVEDSPPDRQGTRLSQEAEVDANSPITSARRRTGPAANYPAPRNPFTTTTPGKVMALSQVFNETQAPTSVLRQSTPNRLETSVPHSSRPSPNIGLRLHPDLSPELHPLHRQPVRQKSDHMADGYKRRHGTDVKELHGRRNKGDHDEDMEDAEEDSRVAERANETSSTISSQDSEAEFSEQEDVQVADRAASLSPAISDTNSSVADGEDERSEDDDESEREHESSEDLSESERGSVVTGASDGDDDDENSNDSMVKDTHNDFMANIKESAKYISQRTPVASRKMTEESDDDSD